MDTEDRYRYRADRPGDGGWAWIGDSDVDAAELPSSNAVYFPRRHLHILFGTGFWEHLRSAGGLTYEFDSCETDEIPPDVLLAVAEAARRWARRYVESEEVHRVEHQATQGSWHGFVVYEATGNELRSGVLALAALAERAHTRGEPLTVDL
jgi:hypothetical protein